jgi:hypothetical protein
VSEEKQESAAGITPEDGDDHDDDKAQEPHVDGRSRLSEVASSIAGAAGPMISAAKRPVDSLATGARRMFNERPGARVRRVRRMAREPLENLWDAHPEAHRAALRELGLMSVPVDKVRGTAVEGPVQRAGDFLPLKNRRSDDWRSRWQRILNAIESLKSLPPIDLIRFGDEYWVEDGHNRMAAALYTGQDEIDAVVTDLRLPGMAQQPVQRIAGVLEGSLDLREAGAGRLTRTSVRPTDLGSVRHHTRADGTGRDLGGEPKDKRGRESASGGDETR